MVVYSVAETPETTTDPIGTAASEFNVMRMQMSLTMEQVTVVYKALKHLRAAETFAAGAMHAAPHERQEARRNIFIIDHLKGMFE